MPTPRLIPGHTAVLVIDIQEKLLPHMHNASRILEQADRLLRGAAVLNLPVLVTEQYRKGLGPTVPQLAPHLARALICTEKMQFSALVEQMRRTIAEASIRCLIVCGIEAHVCVLQSCLDALNQGLVTTLATDAIGSRRSFDQEIALQRMIQAGVVPTTVESALLELAKEAGTPAFKALLPIIK